jgi:hypothetical protein
MIPLGIELKKKVDDIEERRKDEAETHTYVYDNQSLIYYRARYYDAAVGRFALRDELSFIENNGIYVCGGIIQLGIMIHSGYFLLTALRI